MQRGLAEVFRPDLWLMLAPYLKRFAVGRISKSRETLQNGVLMEQATEGPKQLERHQKTVEPLRAMTKRSNHDQTPEVVVIFWEPISLWESPRRTLE